MCNARGRARSGPSLNLGLGPLRPAVLLAAGEDHLVDVGEAELASSSAKSLAGRVENRQGGRVLGAPELLLRGDHLVDRNYSDREVAQLQLDRRYVLERSDRRGIGDDVEPCSRA